MLTYCAAARALAALAWAASSYCCRAAASASAALASAAAWALAAALGSSALSPWKVLAKALPAMVPTTAPTAAPATVPIMPEPALAAGAAAAAAGAGAAAALAGAAGVAAAGRWAAAGAAGAAGLAGALLTAAGRAMGFFAPPRRLAWATEGMAKAAIVTARTEAVARREVVVIRITFFGVREDVERVHDLLMGVRARLRAVCVVANPRNSQAIAVVCALQPIPNRIPHTFIRDHEHVLRQRQTACHGCAASTPARPQSGPGPNTRAGGTRCRPAW